MGKTNRTSVFSSFHMVMNEYEETRMQMLTYTKILKRLFGSFRSMMESYRRYGYDTSVLY